MKRGSLFFIGLISAIITIISLNAAFGSRWNNYNYHHCYKRNDKQYRNEDHQYQPKADSSGRNY